MKLDTHLRWKIQASLLIKAEVKEKILHNWGSLDKKTQNDILILIQDSFELERLLLSSAAEKDSNLNFWIKKCVQRSKLEMMREKELEEEKDEPILSY